MTECSNWRPEAVTGSVGRRIRPKNTCAWALGRTHTAALAATHDGEKVHIYRENCRVTAFRWHDAGMLLQFSVSNYRCFRELQTLNLAASSQDKTLPENLIATDLPGLSGKQWLKGVAIYGGNASGKSTVIEALKALATMVSKSGSMTDPADPIPQIEPFGLAPEQAMLVPIKGHILRLPVVAAPMFLISGPELVLAACRAGIVGALIRRLHDRAAPTGDDGDALFADLAGDFARKDTVGVIRRSAGGAEDGDFFHALEGGKKPVGIADLAHDPLELLEVSQVGSIGTHFQGNGDHLLEDLPIMGDSRGPDQLFNVGVQWVRGFFPFLNDSLLLHLNECGWENGTWQSFWSKWPPG